MKNKLTHTGTDNKVWILPKSSNKFSSAEVLPAQFCYQLSKIKWEDPVVIRKLEAIVASQSKRVEATKQALLDLDRRVSEYHELIEAIRRQISDPQMIAVVLQEIRKDMRTSEERQKSYHSPSHRLPQTETPQNPLTKDQTSRLITAIMNYLKNP
jgi:hypothetical protein